MYFEAPVQTEKEDWLKRAELMLSTHKTQLDKHGDRMDAIASQVFFSVFERGGKNMPSS